MKITRKSKLSGITRTLDLPITQEQIDQWKDGASVSSAMPDLSLDDRRFFGEGVTAEEFEAFLNASCPSGVCDD